MERVVESCVCSLCWDGKACLNQSLPKRLFKGALPFKRE